MRKRRTEALPGKSVACERSLQISKKDVSFCSFSVRCCFYCLIVVVLTNSVLLWLLPSSIDPQPFHYSEKELPSFSGSLLINDHLKKARRLFVDEIVGPEALTRNHEGFIYTGLGDGRIIQLNTDLSSFTEVARMGQPPYDNCDTEKAEESCGRPLGMEFHHTHVHLLYIADSSLGLIQLNTVTGERDLLLATGTKVDGNKIKFLNDLTILNNDTILISESSYKHTRAENRFEFLEGGSHGRLLYYNLFDGSYGVLVNKLHFSNGICLSHDKESVLIVETTRARILKYYLSGDKAGKTDVFIDNLPGLPDNISPSSTGGYWIGIAVVRTFILDFLADAGVMIRKILSKWLFLMKLVEMMVPSHSLILEVDPSGEIVHSLHDYGGDTTSATSHILDLGDRLLIGSYFAPFLLELKL